MLTASPFTSATVLRGSDPTSDAWRPSPPVHGDPIPVDFPLEGFATVSDPVHEALHVGDAVCDVGDIEGLDGWFQEGAGHEHDGL